ESFGAGYVGGGVGIGHGPASHVVERGGQARVAGRLAELVRGVGDIGFCVQEGERRAGGEIEAAKARKGRKKAQDGALMFHFSVHDAKIESWKKIEAMGSGRVDQAPNPIENIGFYARAAQQ